MPQPASIKSSRTAVDRDAVALHAAVSELVRVYQFRDRDRICCHDISVTQCHALEALVAAGPMRLMNLAERLYLDKSTSSRVVSALVKKGYVEQHPDPVDARATALSATKRGRQLYQRIQDGLVAQQRELIEDLDPTVRAGVVDTIRRLARAADARFRAGQSVPAESCCAPGATSSACP
ncbi:DNA-binding transcriptional repressor MarR [Luteitalea pratensis]|uniref:DNA-binding transcriptional repressor MarR n=1 Tax=Luteitalea pratensis TaxID=1855912 RepID=A0A143PRJ4_LUTPR|nr:MarR family winged helix-turn-helix transcriptional regulator [Luteitalea pratensis]AMY10803.1 DNA-binding transcriptional repressor MarR [Luteitalea pratensis]